MAESKKGAVLSAGASDVTVSTSDPMPPDEPGHKGAEINAGATPFDPNAARRYAEGRGPGMQDSERLQPAHWVQQGGVAGVLSDLEQRKQQLEREMKNVDAEIKRVKDEGQ